MLTLDTVETGILARVIAPETPLMSEAVAREILQWRFSEADQRRMSDLAAKARAGTLLSEEVAEAEAYERVSSFLGLVKSKARWSLRSAVGES